VTTLVLKITALTVAASAILCRFLFSWNRQPQLLAAGDCGSPGVALFSSRQQFAPHKHSHKSADPRRHIVVRGLTKTEAEDVLDWLECHGQPGVLNYVEGEGFAVR
jgi:hypothetical protein